MNSSDSKHKVKVVAVDFDGVINDYKGWKGLGAFEGVVPGCREELLKLRDAGCTIIIFTTRGLDIKAVERFLIENSVPFDLINRNAPDAPDNVGKAKVLANVYIDDSAVNFSGRWLGMAERVLNFQPWYKTAGRRPTFGIELLGYRADQFALAVPNGSLNTYIDSYKSDLGITDWAIDHVEAVAEFAGQKIIFDVNLAFNYSIFGFEFELLEPSLPLPAHLSSIFAGSEDCSVRYPMLSHIGFHVPNFAEALDKFRNNHFDVYAAIETLRHSGCPHRYRYAFVDTKARLGFDAKLICRI